MTTNAGDSLSPTGAELGQSRAWVFAGSAMAILVFLGALALLYVSWARNGNPNAIVVLQTEAVPEGASVTLSPLGGAMRYPLTAPLKNGAGHQVLFHVPQGVYRISVRNERGDVIFPNKYEMGEVRAFSKAESLVVLQARGTMQSGKTSTH